MAVFPMIKGVPSGGSSKYVTDTFSSVTGETTITIPNATKIIAVEAYYTSNPSGSMSFGMVDDSDNSRISPFVIDGVSYGISAITNNQFKHKWNGAYPNGFTYVAYVE